MSKRVRTAIRMFALFVVIVPIRSLALAQTADPADDFLRRQAGQMLEQRLDALEEATPKAPRAGVEHGVSTQVSAASTASPQLADTPAGACVSIDHVEISGVTLLSRDKLNSILATYRRQCVHLSDINVLLKTITDLYLDAGYVDARVYVPEQDMARSKQLRLVAAEGSLSDIYLNGKPAKTATMATAFPGMQGKPMNMRDVEQGLDQINRLSSNNAKTSVLAGNEADSSILNVENKPDLPWHFSVSNNNLGQKSTGYSRSSIAFRMDNLAGQNDLVALNYEHSGGKNLWHEDGTGHSDSLSGTFSVPYGYWTFTLNGSLYKYRSAVAGNYDEHIDTSGNSGQIGLSADHVIRRDQNSITTLNAGLTFKKTDNFLMGDLIEVGSRQYPVATFGISHSIRMLGGVWVFDLAYNQGLGLLGATSRHALGAGDAEPEFSKVTGTVNVSRPFELGTQSLQFAMLINAQYSPDNLYGAEQISLGGYSNVRGSRESILFGNNGAFARNEIVWRTVPWAGNGFLTARFGELRPYAAVDYGHVFSQRRFDIDGGDVLGWTLGTRLAGGNIGADIGYSQMVKASDEGGLDHLFFVTSSIQF